MRKTMLLTLFIISFGVAFSQTAKENLENDFTNFVNLKYEGQFEKSLDYLAEDIFKMIPKEAILAFREETRWGEPVSMIEDEILFYVTLTLGNLEILETSNIEKIKDRRYAIITFRKIIMEVQIPTEGENLENAKEKGIELTKFYSKILGAGNVEYNEETNVIKIKEIRDIIAVSKNGIDTWKFMDTPDEVLLTMFIPQKILKRTRKKTLF